jgi:hypothetical protein
MTLTLPYEFDTSAVVKTIVRGGLELLGIVIVPGIFYSLLVSHRVAAAVQLLLIGAVVTFFGRVFLRNLTGSRGRITADAVIVEPATVYGLRLHGPVGTFPIRDFERVRVECIFGPLGTSYAPRWHERVSLIGKGGTPEILIARTDLDAGRAVGHEVAAALGLAYQEQIVPH